MNFTVYYKQNTLQNAADATQMQRLATIYITQTVHTIQKKYTRSYTTASDNAHITTLSLSGTKRLIIRHEYTTFLKGHVSCAITLPVTAQQSQECQLNNVFCSLNVTKRSNSEYKRKVASKQHRLKNFSLYPC